MATSIEDLNKIRELYKPEKPDWNELAGSLGILLAGCFTVLKAGKDQKQHKENMTKPV